MGYFCVKRGGGSKKGGTRPTLKKKTFYSYDLNCMLERSDNNESLPPNKNQDIGLRNKKYINSTTRKDLKSEFSEFSLRVNTVSDR